MTDNLYNGSRLTAHGEDSIQFSIIVPVYNCEKYLIKCLDSLCNQDIFTLTNSRNYEIIIVDDGSTDKSGEICDSYAEKFSFIHVTHTENHGVAHARNIALKQCQGNYIMFSDPDDFVSPQLISVMTRAVELDNQADMFVFKFQSVNYNTLFKNWPVYDTSNMKKSDFIYNTNEELCFRISDGSIGGYPWNKVVKSEIIKQNRFNENLYVMSDEYFFLELLSSHKNMRICCIDYYLYCYILHKESGITRNFDKLYFKSGYAKFIYTLEQCLRIKDLPLKAKKQLQYNLYASTIHAIYRCPIKIKPGTYRKLKLYIKLYGCKYYFRSKAPLKSKLKTFIKHVLLLIRKK